MIETGRLAEIWRYPVKSMRGEPLAAARVEERGVEGDRRFGILDLERGSILSAKRAPALFLCAARYDGGELSIELPGGEVLGPGDALDGALSDLVGRDVRLARAEDHPGARIQMAEADTTTEGESHEWAAPPGTFFDASPIHFLTTSTLRRYRGLYPDGDFDPRRFRANFVVDTGALDGFVEEGWIGSEVRLGGVGLHVTKTCSRCVMTTLEQPGLARDRGILQTIARQNSNNLGVRAVVTAAGRVRVGDALTI
jgi:uncharacterized protein YcbX